MKRLFVGCRVRILWSLGWPELAGQEGRITAPAWDGGVTGRSQWIVAPDCWGSPIAPPTGNNGGNCFAPNSNSLEPIIPEGHQLVSWEAMKGLWTPEGVVA